VDQAARSGGVYRDLGKGLARSGELRRSVIGKKKKKKKKKKKNLEVGSIGNEIKSALTKKGREITSVNFLLVGLNGAHEKEGDETEDRQVVRRRVRQPNILWAYFYAEGGETRGKGDKESSRRTKRGVQFLVAGFPAR